MNRLCSKVRLRYSLEEFDSRPVGTWTIFCSLLGNHDRCANPPCLGSQRAALTASVSKHFMPDYEDLFGVIADAIYSLPCKHFWMTAIILAQSFSKGSRRSWVWQKYEHTGAILLSPRADVSLSRLLE